MPQTFQVLKCYKCEVFQVHPTKKSTKWQCKLCGEKQSIKRFYGLGTGKECRLHVQKLNGIRGEIDCNGNTTSDLSDTSESEDQPDQVIKPVHSINHKSKWLDYVDTQEEVSQGTSDDTMHINNTEVVLELPAKRKKKSLNVLNNTSRTLNVINKNETYESQNKSEISSSLQETGPIGLSGHSNDVSSYLESDKLSTNSYVHKPVAMPNKHLPTPVANNSKWAQFVEPQHENDENEPSIAPVAPVFSFFEDENIDSILDEWSA